MSTGGLDPEILRAFGFVAGIGAVFAVSVALGLGLGLLIDRLIGGGALVVAVGLALGVLAGGFGVYRWVMRDAARR